MNDLQKLKNYIYMLKKNHNLSVSLKIDENTEITEDKIKILISPLCSSLGINYEKPDLIDDGNDLVVNVKNYIHKNRNRDITSDDICRELNCSRSLVSHQFKTQTGMSLREYLTKLRLKDAKTLLENSNLTVTDIAFTVGFGSSNYFANVFKKEIGMSPNSYRKAARKNGED